MALHRGIQSAIFYYASCAPCAEARVRKRRKQEAERDRAEREAMEAHMPGLYRQPDPSSTNPYWQAEIDAGPIPMRTKKRIAESNKLANSTRSNIASSVSVDASMRSMERSDSGKSGLEQFQRQDEVLWGSYKSGDSLRPPSSRHSSGLPKQPPRAKINDQPPPRTYQHMQNAAINDLHPPTTRKVGSKDEVSWMLQPPPLPEVMNGTGAVLNRSSSNVTRPSTSSRHSHSKQADSIADDDEAEKSERRSSTLRVPEPTVSPVHRSKTLPIRQSQEDAWSKAQLPRKQPPLQFEPATPRSIRTATRPQLSTVLSESLTPGLLDGSENDEPHRTSSFNSGLPHSMQVSQTRDLASRMSPAQYKWLETRMVIPRRESLDEHGSESNASPENFDAWHAPEFELPQWIHEHTKREVRQRWSFDM